MESGYRPEQPVLRGNLWGGCIEIIRGDSFVQIQRLYSESKSTFGTLGGGKRDCLCCITKIRCNRRTATGAAGKNGGEGCPVGFEPIGHHPQMPQDFGTFSDSVPNEWDIPGGYRADPFQPAQRTGELWGSFPSPDVGGSRATGAANWGVFPGDRRGIDRYKEGSFPRPLSSANSRGGPIQ